MRTLSILAFGAIALLTMEVAYSVQIQKIEVRGASKMRTQGFAFCGPVTATLKTILNLDPPAAPTPIRSL